MSENRIAIIRGRLARLSLAAQAALVAGVLAAAALLVAPIALRLSGVDGLLAVGVGAGLNLLGAELALVATSFFRGPAAAVQAMAAGMMTRTAIPLLLGVVLHLKVPALAASGMVFYLLAFYMLTLSVETVLMLAQVGEIRTRTKSL